MTSAQINASQSAIYTYDADGHRVRRNTGGGEVWQVYGMGGELLAEYAAAASPSQPQVEYGYRSGELLVTATVTGGWGPPPTFTGPDPLTHGDQIKVEQLTDLRNAVNQLRQHAGLAAFSFTVDPDPGRNVTSVKADHIRQLRTALEEARSHLGLSTGGYTHQTLAEQSSLIYAIDFQELRDQIRGAWGSGAGGVEMRWLVTDQLGTPRMVIDHTGSLSGVRRHDYFPFGEEIGADPSWRTAARGYGGGDSVRQKFASYERDNETGLDYAQARYYANIQGRFTSVDPSRKSIVLTNPQSWNRYSYTLNNPLAYVDKNGKWPTSIHERIIDLALLGLSNDQRQMIKRASYDVDHKSGAQSTENSYKLGMRATNESVDDTYKKYAQMNTDWKKAAQRTSDQNTALYAFGVAFHTVSDMTSPEHEGFQVW